MKCRECKVAILLSDELITSEREWMEKHIESCEDCKQFYVEAKQFLTLINKAASAKPQVVSPELVTDAIMNRVLVEKRKVQTTQWSLTDFVPSMWPRYSLAGISICLIVFFVIEVMQPGYNTKESVMTVSNSREVILKSKSLRENFKKREEERPVLIALCVAPNTGKIDVNCVKQKLLSTNF